MNEIHPIQIRILALHKIRPLRGLSYREIGRQIADDEQRVHPQVVKYHIEQLITNGQLSSTDKPITVSPQKLAQQVTSKPALVRIPLMGAVNAGPARMLANKDPESFIQLSAQLLRSKNYPDLIALRVSGNSMNQANLHGAFIENNDYIIVDRSRRTPRNREIVIINNDDLVNIKRIIFDHDHEQVGLISESTEHFDPIFLSAHDNIDAFIEGTAMQVIKMQVA